MASKEEQAVKNRNMKDANQENEKKDGKDQDANKREPMALLSGASEYYVPRGEGNGTPLQYSCLENPMDGGAW